MNNDDTLKTNQLDHRTSYLLGCFGAAGLVIGSSEVVLNHTHLGFLKQGSGFWFGWIAICILQIVTLLALRRRLLRLGLNSLWLLLLLLLWFAYDLPLIVYKDAYMVLPLLYGVSGIPLFFRRLGGAPLG